MSSSVDVREHNREAWDRQVEKKCPWTIPATDEQIRLAQTGECRIYLTPCIAVPAAWLEPLPGRDVLCLASGGGQQGPLLAAAGAHVTVFDNSPAQLAQDRATAERFGLLVRTVEGDMRDLSVFADESFDLIVHPVSNVFVPELAPVWKEAFRVLRKEGSLLSGFDNPVRHIFDEEEYDRGRLVVRNRLPFSQAEALSPEQIRERRERGLPLEFSHTLDEQIGGQIAAGFVLVGLYEDHDNEDSDLLSRFAPTFIATRAIKAAI